jgi:GTPase Era involved in 16S rRNA processing
MLLLLATMRILENLKLASALYQAEQAHRLFCELAQKDAAAEIDRVINAARDERFVVGVVGSTNRGKSTLINGLLGRHNDDCAPVGKRPSTNVISIFGFSDTPCARVVFADTTTRKITEREIRLYVTEDHNPANEKKVRSVEVLAPFAGLEKGVYVVDTPGANNGLTALHGEVLRKFLPAADAVIFLVAAEEPITEADQRLLQAIKDQHTRKLFFAVNMVDRVDSGELDRNELAQGIDHNRKILTTAGFPEATIYEVSARNYFEKQDDPGSQRLLDAVRNLIANGRLEALIKRVRDRTRGLLEQCHAELSGNLHNSKATTQELEDERKALEVTRSALVSKTPAQGRRFAEGWNVAFDDLDKDLRRIRTELHNQYAAFIDAASSMRVPALAQTIHVDVQVSFAERLRPAMLKCEDRLSDAMDNLQTSIQAIMLSASPHITPGATVQPLLKDRLKVAGAAVPALITGTASAALPGIVGSLIASAQSCSAAAIWCPFWCPFRD